LLISKRFRCGPKTVSEPPKAKNSLRVAFEFRTVERLEDVLGDLIEERLTVGGGASTFALAGGDEILVFELGQCLTDDLFRARDVVCGCNRIAVRAAFGATVLGCEAFDTDRPVDGDFSQEAGRTRRPEVVLLWWEFAVLTGFGVLDPLRLLDAVCEPVGEFSMNSSAGTS